MLSRLILALIILTIGIGGTIQVSSAIDGYLNEGIMTPDEISSDWLMVRPGENATISFEILLDKGHNSVDVPVPEIYTYIYSNDTSYRLSTEERTYEYLICSVYDKVNITDLMKTFVVPVNVTVLDDDSIFYISYIFAPSEDEYNNSTVFFIQNIEYVSYIVKAEEESLDQIWLMWVLIVPFVVIAFFSLLQMGESSSRRRRRRRRSREIESEYQRSLERLRVLRRSLGTDHLYTPSHTRVPSEELMRPSPPPPTVFKCRNKKDGMREFVKGDGMFEIGIKKFKVPSLDEQVKMINDLPEIESFSSTSLELVVNLNEYGRYFLKLRTSPTVYRVEDDETMSYRNPYIHNGDFHLCLGTGQKLYNRCYENKHYVECIRILCEVLKSKHGTGYRKWSDCGM